MDTSQNQEGTVLINTIANNKSNSTTRDYSRAIRAHRLQRIIACPITCTLLKSIDNNKIKDCPITRKDVIIAKIIFGPDVGSIKAKTTCCKAQHVVVDVPDIPLKILKLHHDVTLTADIMYINGIPFFVSTSRKPHFSIVKVITNKKNDNIVGAIQQISNIYKQGGFKVMDILLDGKFKSTQGKLAGMGIKLNPVSKNEHVPEVKNYIWRIKEQTCSIYRTLSSQKMPPCFIAEMEKTVNFWMNSFPHADGVSDTLGPRTIITGSTTSYSKHCTLEFGEYCQVHEDEINNSMAKCTHGALTLHPIGNSQDGFYFFSLTTGQILKCQSWMPLPMPNVVITRIHTMTQ